MTPSNEALAPHFGFRGEKLALFLVLIFLAGCGVKTDPVVPRSAIPQTTEDLDAASHRGSIILQWSLPGKDTDDKSLTNLGGFRVWRNFTPLDKIGCSTCESDYRVQTVIDYQALPKEVRSQGKITYWDDPTEGEGEYAYRLTSYTTAGVESNFSNEAFFYWLHPPQPPTALRAVPGDRSVDLFWEAPAPNNRTPEATFSGFNLYRRETGQDYGLVPLNPHPLKAQRYQDLEVANGKKYYYVITSLRTTEKGQVEGGDSMEAAATPKDLTPPASPSATIAFQSPEGVVISWEPNLESDLLGYYVYRRLESQSKPNRLSPLLKRETMYLDKTFSAGVTYYYSVTAVDQSPQCNESSTSQELKVTTQAP